MVKYLLIMLVCSILVEKQFLELKIILFQIFSVYSTLIGSTPKSYIDVTIGELKSINVHFVGFVNIPGVHLVHPFSNVINGLIQAGGVDIKGSLREIQIIRKSKVISITDLYSYLLQGKPLKDIRLNDQDIIYVLLENQQYSNWSCFETWFLRNYFK